MQDYDHIKLTKTLNEEGLVAMKETANFYTNPAKKGHMRATPSILFGNFAWKKEPYARKRNAELAYRRKIIKKMKDTHEKPFYIMHHGQEPVNSSRRVLEIKNLCSVIP